MASRITQLTTAFGAALADSTVTLREGRAALAETGGLPRITHVPIGGDVTATEYPGEGLVTDPVSGIQVRDKIVAVRSFNLQMYCQGANREITEQLLHNAIAAWYSACSGSVAFSQEDWIDQQEGAGDKVTHGHLVSLLVNLQIPVYATAKPLTIARSTGQDMTLTTGDLWGDGATYGSGHQYHTGDNLTVTQTF